MVWIVLSVQRMVWIVLTGRHQRKDPFQADGVCRRLGPFQGSGTWLHWVEWTVLAGRDVAPLILRRCLVLFLVLPGLDVDGGQALLVVHENVGEDALQSD